MIISIWLFSIISIPIYLCFCLYWLQKKISLRNLFLFSIFYIYLTGLIGVTFFPFDLTLISSFWDLWENLRSHKFIPWLSPFSYIISLLTLGNIGEINMNIVGNFILLLPAGILIPMIWDNIHSWKDAIKFGFIISLIIESMQLVFSLFFINHRFFDANDIVMNMTSFFLGYVICVCMKKFL